MRRHLQHPQRFLRNHAGNEGLRQALAEGTPAAIAAAIARIRDGVAVDLHQSRAVLRP